MEDADKWGLWQGNETRLMQVHEPDITTFMLNRNYKNTITFITRGDEDTLNAIRDLHNAQVRAQQGE